MTAERPQVSLRRNIIFSYASQLYVTLIGIVLVPLYIKYMGAEAYGLVGFFALLQSWFGMLDLGLTLTISRETARYRGAAISPLAYYQLFRALSAIFFGIAIVGGVALFVMSDVVATRWLNAKNLDHSEVLWAVQIMTVSVPLRWMGGLYRGVIVGSERLVWMSSFNALIATLRFVVVMLSMWTFGFSPLVFFTHQLIVAFFEIVGLFFISRRLLPSTKEFDRKVEWSFRAIQPLLKFGLTIAFTSSVWVLVTQTDKLVLSGILMLEEYAYFSLAVLVASGIMIVSGPISSALMPRMARLNSEGDNKELIRLYRKSTRLVALLAGSVAMSLMVCAEPLLFAWSGNIELTRHSAPILMLYAAGNGLLAIGAFPYYLQYAKGDLRYHLIGNAALVGLMIPAILFFATKFGGVGAGYVWLVMNAVYLFFWLAYVHGKLEPGLHVHWLFRDVFSVAVVPLVFVAILILFPSVLDLNVLTDRFDALVRTLTLSACVFGLSFLSYSVVGKYK